MASLVLAKRPEFSLNLPVDSFLTKVFDLLDLTAERKISQEDTPTSLDREILVAINELNDFSKTFPEIKNKLEDLWELAMTEPKIGNPKIDPDGRLVDELEKVLDASTEALKIADSAIKIIQAVGTERNSVQQALECLTRFGNDYTFFVDKISDIIFFIQCHDAATEPPITKTSNKLLEEFL